MTWKFKLAILGLSTVLMAAPASADVFELDFTDDPADLGVDFYGTSEWRDSDGVDDSGYLSITDALNSQRGAIVFPDLTGGQALNAFAIEADLRVGGGTSRPADGFSFNFARDGDPVLDDGEGWASSPTNEGNLPEEGTTTGVAIGFDEWFSGGTDVVGLSIRVDNNLVNQYEFPILNGEVDDEESLQTGPEGVFDDELQDLMGWAHLSIELCQNNLTVTYKGVEAFNEPIEYAPSTGALVFGGRTGGANAYHHLDNIQIRTGGDIRPGTNCELLPPIYIGGQGTVGTRTFDGSVTNKAFGPEQPGADGFRVKLVDSELTISDHSTAEFVLEDDDGEVSTGSYTEVDFAGGGGTFSVNNAYPNGVADTSMEDFAVEAIADVTIPAGTWTIGFGSDDGGRILIEGVEFEDSQNNDNFSDDEVRYEGNRGHGWTVGTFTLDEPLTTTIIGSFHERGGGDSFEIAVLDDGVIEDASPDTGWELLSNGTFGWEVTHTGTPLVSADIDGGSLGTEIPYEFDVNGDTGEADVITVVNPDESIYTTIFDVDGATLQIAGTGTFTNGERFTIIDANTVNGTPVIASLNPAQTWLWDNGDVVFGSIGPALPGDYNNDGVVNVADVDLQAAAIASATPDLGVYDENSDGVVDFADRQILISGHIGTWMGDADLNGEFGSSDLVTVFTAGKYETGNAASWAEGDWNGDGAFGSGDLVTAFTDGGYEAGPKAAVAAVPEPSSIVLALVSLIGLFGITRRRNG